MQTIYNSISEWLNQILTDPKNKFPDKNNVIDLEMVPNYAKDMPGHSIQDNVYRSGTENGTYTKINTNAIAGTVYTDTGLTPNATYYYKVSSIFGSIEGVMSSAIPAHTPPLKPENLTAQTVSDSSIDLSWNVKGGAAGYVVEVYNAASALLGILDKITDTEYSVTGLSPNTRYFFAVKAVNAAGIEGEPSDKVAVLTLLSPPQPRITRQLSRSIELSWQQVAGANSYKVYHSKEDSFENAIQNKPGQTLTKLADTVERLDTDTPYYFWVQAFYNNGENQSSPSPSAEGRTIKSSINIAFDFSNPADPVLEDIPEFIRRGTEDSYVVTVKTDGGGWANTYKWYLDGPERKTADGSSFTIDWRLTVGSYTLTVVATKNGVPYSASVEFKVINN